MTIEDLNDGIKEYIEKYIQDYLDDVSDELEVKSYAQIYRATEVDIMALRNYPALIFEYGRATRMPDAPLGWDRFIVPISFYSVSLGNNPEDLQRLSERYCWALYKLLLTNRTLEGLVEDVQIAGWEFSPNLPRSGGISISTGKIDVNFIVLLEQGGQ